MDSQDQFCGHCGNPRIVGMGVCPHCGSAYHETYTGSVVQGSSQFTPPTGMPTSLGGMPGIAPPPLPFPGQVASNAIPFHPVTPAQPTSISPLPQGNLSPGRPTQTTSGKSFRGKLIVGQGIIILLLLAVVLGFVLHSSPGISLPTSSATNSSSALGAKLTATPGAITENMLLKTCGGCDDPVLVTITKITITTSNMIWSIQLQDNIGVRVQYNEEKYTLIDPTGHESSGVMASGGLVDLEAAQNQYDSATFPFVPYTGETYRLTVNMVGTDFNDHFYNIQFEPASFTF